MGVWLLGTGRLPEAFTRVLRGAEANCVRAEANRVNADDWALDR